MQPDINTIIIPEGCHVEFSEDNKVARIVKNEEKHQGARTWKEFCEKKGVRPVWRIDAIAPHKQSGLTYRGIMGSEYFNSEKECRAFDALKELLLLHKDWVGDWEPDWSEPPVPLNGEYDAANTVTSIRFFHNGNVYFCFNSSTECKLTFPNYGMAQDFYRCFKPLLETAKPLL